MKLFKSKLEKRIEAEILKHSANEIHYRNLRNQYRPGTAEFSNLILLEQKAREKAELLRSLLKK